MGTEGTPADFGNPSQAGGPASPPQQVVDETMMPTEACEVGVFCPPTGPDGSCGKITFEAKTEVTHNPGNVLLVFDRSASMADRWEGQMRWQVAGEAIASVLDQLKMDIAQAGVVFFPTPPDPATCLANRRACNEVCSVEGGDASHIEFIGGEEFLARFAMPGAGTPTAVAGPAARGFAVTGEEPPYFPVPLGRTPLLAGLQQAQEVLTNTNLEGTTAVIVITDGQPNCAWNATAANQIVSDWRTNLGIHTYVIGLPGVSLGGGFAGPQGGGLPGLALGDGSQVLNDLAQAGGTDQFITPSDPATLESQLRSIVSETVSTGFNTCNIDLSPPVAVPDELLMIVEEPSASEKLQVPRDFGWELNGTNDQVVMTGKLCQEAMAGRFTAITFEYACPEAPPPPPLPPLK